MRDMRSSPRRYSSESTGSSSHSVSSFGSTLEQCRLNHLKSFCRNSLTRNHEIDSNCDSDDDVSTAELSKLTMPGKGTAIHENLISLRRKSLERNAKRLNLARYHRRMDQLHQQHQKAIGHPELQSPQRQLPVFQELKMSGVEEDEALYRQRMYAILRNTMGCCDGEQL
mmetsp:Transcript_30119/g.44501  ORF Transcript_30119/g.44501 Transcript_30119/m.44501 type:complete len:169 (+) Transcript_30119:339-845(+)